ncbi:glycoside hydrolase family 16 protein [Cryptosporangium arvum]|uniref:Beta-glucanase/beta-glucan synthetase n=1 Tax=Cryptosporangium arvum DSM 44712 TaxID=927661 RepID=A0A010ZSC8_9ACTN|nr:glycoside hydrolase family 16 protein [Cryptosporangium arvum]EXG81589.1 beta-glucanase/beta-glucan synthetase [Cryptosporangium arvum DSM 44712]
MNRRTIGAVTALGLALATLSAPPAASGAPLPSDRGGVRLPSDRGGWPSLSSDRAGALVGAGARTGDARTGDARTGGGRDVALAGRAFPVWSARTAAASGLVLDRLSVPATAESGQAIAATVRLHAKSTPVAVEALTVAVRNSDGANFDFPGVQPATVPPGGYTFATGQRTFPPGDYLVAAAVRIAGVWTALTPPRYLTVRTNPVTFRQEFSGPAGAGPNYGLSTAMWFDDPRGDARYSLDQAKLDGLGRLALTAEPGPVAPRLSMLDRSGNDGAAAWSQQGGYFAARMKLPAGRGLRPAFRTIGADAASVAWPESGGIDIAEVAGERPGLVRQFAHGGTPDLAYGRAHDLPARGAATDWHVYALDWKPGENGHLRWSVDGVVTQELRAAGAGAAWASFRRPHTLALELAIDGPAPQVPATALIDWIRVYRYPIGSSTP